MSFNRRMGKWVNKHGASLCWNTPQQQKGITIDKFNSETKLKDVMLCERRQSQKVTCHIIPFIRHSQKDNIIENGEYISGLPGLWTKGATLGVFGGDRVVS